MTEQTVAMYCFIDDLLAATRPAWAPAPDPRQHLSDAEVLTTALVAAHYFGANLAQARRYMQDHWGQRPLHKSGFSRQLHGLQDVLDELFATLGQLLKDQHTEGRFVLDSFPVPVCHNTRIGRSKLLTGKAYHGWCVSKRCGFYGVKVQVLARVGGRGPGRANGGEQIVNKAVHCQRLFRHGQRQE